MPRRATLWRRAVAQEPMPLTSDLVLSVTYDPQLTDPEALASALDILLDTALSTSDVLDDCGPITADISCPDAAAAPTHPGDQVTDSVRLDLIKAARELHGCDDVQVDDNAAVSAVDFGTWVAAWLWVPGSNPELQQSSERHPDG